MWYVYLLRCREDVLYVGHTDNLNRRIVEHLNGSGGQFTSIYRPVQLLYSEKFDSESKAVERESQIKRWSRHKKLALAAGDMPRLKSLSVSRDH